MKRFLLGAFGALGLVGQLALAQEPVAQPKVMPRTENPPVSIRYEGSPLDRGCDEKMDCCDNGGGGNWHLIGGADFLYLRPQFNQNRAINTSFQKSTTTVTAPTVGTPTTQNTTNSTQFLGQDFSYDWNVSPRLWFGVENCDGLGARVRWFHYDEGANPAISPPTLGTNNTSVNGLTTTVTTGFIQTFPASPLGIRIQTPAAAPNGPAVGKDFFVATTSLFIDEWDFEVTQKAHICNLDVTFGGGIRYAYLQQTFNVFHPGVTISTGTEVVTSTTASDLVLSRQTFDGVGPMVSLEALRRLGCSNFSLYGSARGAILFGHGHEEAASLSRTTNTQTIGTTGQVLSINTTNNTTTSDNARWDLLPILEVEVGAQWSREMGGANVFLRSGFVGQAYFGGGSANSTLNDFGLVGVSIGAGVQF
jgi:hypothetical protein